MSKYKPGQIVTLKDGNTVYICQIVTTHFGCARCAFFTQSNCPFCTEMCFKMLGSCVYKLLSKHVVEKEKRSNASTKD